MAYANAVSHPARARAIVNAMRSRRVAVDVFGDSNMGQSTGGHWSSWAILLNQRVPTWGGKIHGRGDGGFGSDVRNLGNISGTYVNFVRVATGDDADILDRVMFTASEHSSPPANQYPDGWARNFWKLATGTTSPASGTITGTASVYLNNDSVALLGDIKTLTTRLHGSYFIPSTGGGTLNMAIRGQDSSAFTVYTHNSYTSPTDLVTDFTLDMAPNADTTGRQVQHNRINVNASSGIVYSFPQQITVPARTSGVAVSPVFARGGSTLRHIVGDMVYALAARPLALEEQLRLSCRAMTAGQETVVIVNKMKGNDVGDTSNAWVYGSGTATQTGSASNTAAGYKQNLETFIRLWSEAWENIGNDPQNLHFVEGAYHPQPTGGYTATQQLFNDGAIELANTQSWASRLVVVDGNKLTTSTEMTSLNWYKDNSTDTAHLSTAGFDGFNGREIEGLFTAAQSGGGGPLGGGAMVGVGGM